MSRSERRKGARMEGGARVVRGQRAPLSVAAGPGAPYQGATNLGVGQRCASTYLL
jgi:hypothetical protein